MIKYMPTEIKSLLKSTKTPQALICYCQVPFAGPKYPESGSLLYGTPCASAVFRYTVLPHHFNDPAGKIMQKNIMTVDTATPESSAAEST